MLKKLGTFRFFLNLFLVEFICKHFTFKSFIHKKDFLDLDFCQKWATQSCFYPLGIYAKKVSEMGHQSMVLYRLHIKVHLQLWHLLWSTCKCEVPRILLEQSRLAHNVVLDLVWKFEKKRQVLVIDNFFLNTSLIMKLV